MEHLDVQLAHRLLSGQLDPATQARWLRHVDHCWRCHDLLANERALMAVLDLGQEPTSSQSDQSLDRLLERVENLSSDTSTRRWRRPAWLAGAVAATVGLALLLVWQMERLSAKPAAVAQELRISPELQDKVVANLAALATLAEDPWLVDQYQAVHTLKRLIAGQPLE
ncbi:MAG: hypothetical protein KAY37_10325 [Phycisphaerae bacterium]|nr:hypothetical protein [Phycisphaerae bacterium]